MGDACFRLRSRVNTKATLTYLMSAATVSLGMCQKERLGRGCSLPAEAYPSSISFKLLGFTDIEEVKYRKASLSQ